MQKTPKSCVLRRNPGKRCLPVRLQGLCKLLLAFGQRLNNRLHFSFGDKGNKELPHIAFPLVTSVDSLVRGVRAEKTGML